MPDKKESEDKKRYIERRTEYYKLKKVPEAEAKKKAQKDADQIKKWKSYVMFGFSLLLLALVGCAGLDSVVGYDHATGAVTQGSPIDAAEGVASGFGVYGQIAAIGLAAAAGVYVAVRKIMKKFGK